MFYWTKVLQEVISYQKQGFRCTYTNLQETDAFHEVYQSMEMPKKEKREAKKYYLGLKYPGMYLTQREMECVQSLLKGNTLREAGLELELSSRTVEFYLKNIKKKMQVKKKNEVLAVIRGLSGIDTLWVCDGQDW